MLYEFVSHNRDTLNTRCRAMLQLRPDPPAHDAELKNGVPMLLGQLIHALRGAQHGETAGGGHAPANGRTAPQRGRALLELGFTIDHVVHGFGALCLAITDLAIERGAPFQAGEFRVLCRGLENAIADTLNEYGASDAFPTAYHDDANRRLGDFVHELRNLLNNATLAFSAVKSGHLALDGIPAAIVERSLVSMERLIASSLEEVRSVHRQGTPMALFSLADFIEEAQLSAQLAARARACTLVTPAVDPRLAIYGKRELLLAAVANLLHNAFKFTRDQSSVTLRAHALASRILIEVSDQCGGLPPGCAGAIFLPFSQPGGNRSGLGLGLAIARQSVLGTGGTLEVTDRPGAGCTFTIALPRFTLPPA